MLKKEYNHKNRPKFIVPITLMMIGAQDTASPQQLIKEQMPIKECYILLADEVVCWSVADVLQAQRNIAFTSQKGSHHRGFAVNFRKGNINF